MTDSVRMTVDGPKFKIKCVNSKCPALYKFKGQRWVPKKWHAQAKIDPSTVESGSLRITIPPDQMCCPECEKRGRVTGCA